MGTDDLLYPFPHRSLFRHSTGQVPRYLGTQVLLQITTRLTTDH